MRIQFHEFFVFSMTDGAQQALRRTMEIYSNTTRFALACNYSEKVIEPIQSRCAVLRYSKLSDAQVLARTLQVCQKENVSSVYSFYFIRRERILAKFKFFDLHLLIKVTYTEDGLEAVVFTAQGDMRQALNNLQSTHNGFELVNSQNVFKVCDEPHPMLIKDMLKSCMAGELRRAYKVVFLIIFYFV